MGYVDAADDEPGEEKMEIDESDKIHEIPIDADTLLAYATTPGKCFTDTQLAFDPHLVSVLRDLC